MTLYGYKRETFQTCNVPCEKPTHITQTACLLLWITGHIHYRKEERACADALPALVCLLLHVSFSSNNTCKWTWAVQTHVVLQSTAFLIHGWDSVYVEGHFKLYKDFPLCRWSAPLILVLFKGPL